MDVSEDVATTSGNKKWYEEYPKANEPRKHSKTEVDVIDVKAEAKTYLDAETSAFQLKQSKSRDSETAWLRTAVTQGTTSDKVAAGIVLIQDNPKYNLSRLVTLINQVRVAKHNQCNMVITAIRDLFLSDLLHPECKLLKFEEQNLDQLDKKNSSDTIVKTDVLRKKLMAHWYFEDQLHEQYERFVMSLGTIASDTVDTNRETAISVMTDLLIGNCEQEHKLLELIVNKVGDPSSKVGSKTIFCLNKVLYEHPNMKLVILREIEKLLFRKNVAQRAQYYAICLLTQFLLSKNDGEIAATLIEVYFAFFKACLKKGEPDSRMMAAILTGVNRAYPYAKMESSVLNDHIDSVYKVVHIGSFNVSLNALSLLHQVTGKDEAQENRFYSAFYRKLLDPQIGVVNKRAIFLNLLHRVLQKDRNTQRLYAFIKRILQVTLYFPANMACATLYVVSKVLNVHKGLKDILLVPHVTIKVENDNNECKDDSINSDDIEVCDKPMAETDNTILLTNVTTGADEDAVAKLEIKTKDEIKKEPNEQKEYDPFCRNPAFAGMTKGLATELIALSKHYHPSVALFADTILTGQPIEYTGDPLEDLSPMRFLDRYVFKNPKKLEDKKVQKKNDPLAVRAGYAPRGIRCIPVDSAAYLNEREERIPVDELYLYRYLKKKREFKHTSHAEEDDDDLESVNSEEFNDILDKLGDKDFGELDVAADIKTGKKKKEGDDEDVEDDRSVKSDASDDLEGGSGDEDLEEDDASDDEMQDLSDMDLDGLDDEDLSDMEFGDSDDGDGNSDIESNVNNKITKKNQTKNKKSKGIDNNVFVSAEKFAEMLEEQSRQKVKHGGTDMFSSVDGASSKQIDWEVKRHQKLRGSFSRNKRKGFKTLKKNVKKIKH